MESVPRASVDISTEEKPAPAAGAKNFTLSLNKKVVYGLGLVAIVALGALGVASVSQDGDCEGCMMACNDAGPGTEDDGAEDYGPGPDGESRRRFLQGGPEAGANDPYDDCTNACMAPDGACDTWQPIPGTDMADGSDGGAGDCAMACPESWHADGICDAHCEEMACPGFEDGDGDDCAAMAPPPDCDTDTCACCPESWVADGVCDQHCADSGCMGFEDGDGDDCASFGMSPTGMSPTAAQCAPSCPNGWEGDNYCDEGCNNAACNMDDGDCAAGTEDSGEDYGPGPDGESR